MHVASKLSRPRSRPHLSRGRDHLKEPSSAIPCEAMSEAYVHGYDARESARLSDQAGTLVDLLHHDTAYPAGSRVLEAGCGVGAQTVTLAARSPDARFVSVDVSADSIAEAERRGGGAGVVHAEVPEGGDVDLFLHGPSLLPHLL